MNYICFPDPVSGNRKNIIFLISFYFIFVQINAQQVDVTTSRGPLFGYHVDLGNDRTLVYYGQADVFMGIPFLQPPIGPLRYKVILDEFLEGVLYFF